MARATESHPLRKRWRAAAVVVAAVMPAIPLSQPSMAATTDGGGMAGAQRLAAGLAAWQAGDGAAATGELSRAILLLDPTRQADAVVDAYLYLGLAHLDLAQLDEAAAALGRAAELAPGQPRSLAEIRRWQALVARLAGDVTGAAELRASALALDSPASSSASGGMAAAVPPAAAEVPTPAAPEAAGSAAPASVAAGSASTSAPVAVDPEGIAPSSVGAANEQPAGQPASGTPAFDHFFRRRPAPPAEPTPPPADPP